MQIFFSVDKCEKCDVNADCVHGDCRCRKGYIGTGYICVKGKQMRAYKYDF